jgi:hypothetical protein
MMLQGLPTIQPDKLDGAAKHEQARKLYNLFKKTLRNFQTHIEKTIPELHHVEANVDREYVSKNFNRMSFLVISSFYSVMTFTDWQAYQESQFPILPMHEACEIETNVSSDAFLVIQPELINPTELAVFWSMEKLGGGMAWPKLPNTTFWSGHVDFPFFEPRAFEKRYLYLIDNYPVYT